jgi:hypothetical protein
MKSINLIDCVGIRLQSVVTYTYIVNKTDDTTNIHLGQGPIAATAHEAGYNPKIESRSDVCLLRS